ALDGLERLPPLLLVTVGSAQYLHPAEDGVERHAQLARRLGQEHRPIIVWRGHAPPGYPRGADKSPAVSPPGATRSAPAAARPPRRTRRATPDWWRSSPAACDAPAARGPWPAANP